VIRAYGALLSLVLGSLACSGSSEPEPTGRGTSILLGDSPFPYDLVSRVDIFVVDVKVGVDSGTTGSPCSGEILAVAPNRSFELLALQGGTTAILGAADLPSGEYHAICLTIDTDRSSITLRDGRQLTGTSSPGIQWGSGDRILKAELLEPIAIGGEGNAIAIHFDVGKSFVQLPLDGPPDLESGFAFLSVLQAVDPAKTGSVSGTVLGGTGRQPIPHASLQALVGDTLDPEGAWFVAGTGSSDAAGRFRLAFLAPSTHWAAAGWVYILEANAPSDTPLDAIRIKGVRVSVGKDTPVGEIVFP
jgi:hypothetical protein